MPHFEFDNLDILNDDNPPILEIISPNEGETVEAKTEAPNEEAKTEASKEEAKTEAPKEEAKK